MHPSVQNTYNEVAKTLSGLTVKAEKPVTFGDVCKQIARGAHTRISLEVLAGIVPEMSFEAAMYRLERVIKREAEKIAAKHWSASNNGYLALLEHRQKLEAFDLANARFLEAAE